jgi:CRISPR-associated endonuclease/helicase Cas3
MALDHCLNVGCVAEALLALQSPQLHKQIPPGAATLAALHDIGKVSPGFQVKSEAWLMQRALRDQALKEGWSVRESDHAKISQATVQRALRSSSLHRWAAAVGAHHGRIKGERLEAGEPWEEQRRRLAEELIREFGPLPDQPPGDATVWFVAGLITIADWIGSDERHFSQDARWDMSERRRRAQTALATINWRSAETRQLNGFGDLFPEIPHQNSLQTATMRAVPSRCQRLRKCAKRLLKSEWFVGVVCRLHRAHSCATLRLRPNSFERLRCQPGSFFY